MNLTNDQREFVLNIIYNTINDIELDDVDKFIQLSDAPDTLVLSMKLIHSISMSKMNDYIVTKNVETNENN